jgi:hypothetical protein
MDSVRRCGSVVSVDTEATHLVPPVMVQVATSELILIELVGKGGLSCEMKSLLEDKEIRKVFCDYEADEKCLGVRVEMGATQTEAWEAVRQNHLLLDPEEDELAEPLEDAEGYETAAAVTQGLSAIRMPGERET